ncbi:DJ-1/PfpI family protein [Pseudomonas luteola]|uniref:DJ-1/PfpI family protein n=1 Tax=Pseudomonas luteola TaxID=47886 RepID=UPI00123C03E9|nr:DJ-1/PfpI family protein [Pseudomonas luteola]QEU26719.1 DJ-1/PfpI family protein [Pseudomonas luteola]
MSFSIGYLLFPGIQQLDLTGPYDLFSLVPEVRQYLVWKNLDPVRASSGIAILPDTTLDNCPQLDMLCIPGGAGIEMLLDDKEAVSFVRKRYITSVCTGSLILGAAGLLKGRKATTHWAYLDLLSQFGAQPTQERVVYDGRLITGGGVTAGIDFALSVIAECFDNEQAQRVQLALEYAPAPPFTSGDPRQAPESILTAQIAATKDVVQRRAAAVARAVARL